jgi:hypothetical protein
MDSSFWNKIQPGIKLATTVKQFHGRYLWRLVIHAEGGRLLDSKLASLEAALEHRRAMAQSGYNFGKTGWFYRSPNLDLVDLTLLRTVQEIKIGMSGSVRTRIEEPNIQFYTQDEATLKTIALKIDARYIQSVMYPQPEQVELLRSGAIITRTELGYSHKVIVRDGRYSLQTKQQLLCYLDGLGDTVKLSKTARSMLEKPYESTWGVFFYTNDPAVVTFVSLIDPGLISNIHAVVSVPG